MSKNILIVGINYYPEDSAIGLYTTQKAEYLANLGFEVTVITGFPYYPQWKIQDNYNKRPLFLSETINGVKVLRVKQYVPNNPSFIKRILHLLSFTLGSLINLFKTFKPDVVITIIPFTTSVFLGWLLKIRYKSKLWVHIQDFEFDAALDSGLMKKKSNNIFKSLLWVEKKLLNKADVVSTISHAMLSKLKNKTRVSTYYLTNWIDVSLFSSVNNNSHPYLSSEKFKILYSGNIGAKQDWNLFFNFLSKLRGVDNIEVIVIGEGAEKDRVVKGLKEFSFAKHFNLVPYSELPLLLLSADLHILFQKTDVIDTVMPSKLLGMMASGKPSIVTGNIKSEVSSVLKQSKGGYYLDGESVQEITQHVTYLKENAELSRKMGCYARTYVEENFSKNEVLKRFMNKIENIT